MDKKLILSVAGSGKTTLIISQLNVDSKALILTYTENNYLNLRKRVIQKFGFLPNGIKIFKYFTFLYSFCYRPFLHNKIKAKGYYWDSPPQFTTRLKRCDLRYYLDKSKRLYHNRLVRLLEEYKLFDDINHRIKKYFDSVYVDEVQDFAGHDFNFLISMINSETNLMFVGDFFQHTFDTSRDGNVNCNLYKDYEKYIEKFIKAGVDIDKVTLNRSYRCCKSICEFVSANLKIGFESHREDESTIRLVEDEQEMLGILSDGSIIKLFYQNHANFNCYSLNWGSSKGLDHFSNVCIVLNGKTFELFMNGKLENLNPQTRNKLYVACSRARGNIYFVEEKVLKRLMG
tara:strand:- start:63 stop:1094 length:1032 start_codon:yes stop_codon:yes gene_type:complete